MTRKGDSTGVGRGVGLGVGGHVYRDVKSRPLPPTPDPTFKRTVLEVHAGMALAQHDWAAKKTCVRSSNDSVAQSPLARLTTPENSSSSTGPTRQ